MTTLTYTGRAEQVNWCGVEFRKGEAVPLDTSQRLHRHMLDKAPNNPHFEMGGSAPETEPQDDASSMRARLTEAGVTVPGRAGVKWMADKLKELDSA